jgi:hypothetical protein
MIVGTRDRTVKSLPRPAAKRRNWLGALTLFALLITSAFFVHQRVSAQSVGDPLVLAFYYTWFDDATWNYSTLSDLPAQTYVSSDRAAMGRHIDQAKAAGIDAFLVAWYGPNGNQTESNLAALLDEANSRGFKIGILFETNSPFLGGVGDVTGALQHALSVHANHPAFLRADGRPVIFFWRTQMFGVDTWQNIRSQADSGYSSIWIADGVDTSYLSVFDGHHLYSNTWNPPANLEGVNQKFANQVARARDNTGAYKLWVATAMPGYNDVRIRGGAGFAQDREGGAYYARSWQAAINSQPNWVVITSFNEWPEGTYIEPSAAYGDQYLSLTGQWSQQFKSGGGAQISAAALPPALPTPEPTSVPTPAPTPSAPTVFVETDLLNIRSAPTLDSEVIGQAPAGAALRVIGQRTDAPEWWQIEFNGQPAWVNAALVRTAGPFDQVPRVTAPDPIEPTPVPVDPVQEVAVSEAVPTATSANGALIPRRTRSAPGWMPILSPRP